MSGMVSMSSAHSRFVRRIAELVDRSEKTQRQIAHEMGYDHANLISMFKQGTTRIPLPKVPEFAMAVDADAASLVRFWLATYDPAVLAVIDRVLGTLVSVNEQSWLEGLRAVYAEEVPAFDGDRWPVTHARPERPPPGAGVSARPGD